MFVLLALLALALYPSTAAARDEVVFSAGISQPLGTASHFAKRGTAYELRWRHWNRGHSAYEITGGYSEHGLEGEIQSTIEQYRELVQTKNQLAQLQGAPGQGRMVAEYGAFETYYLTANYIYRFLRRARISPTVSFGGGGYYWRLPFRVKFYNVASFGEQKPWQPVGAPNNSTVYAYDFDEEVLDYSKSAVSGGLSAALGVDVQLSGRLRLGGEARGHLLFSSGQGNLEEGSDDQNYLDNMSFLYLEASLNYGF